MPSVIRHALMFVGVACALLASGSARAAPVVWTIDSALTTLGISGTGKAPLSGSIVNLRLVPQPAPTPAPGLTVTPTVSLRIQGTIVTDTDFTSSITFLKNAGVGGVNINSFTPDITGEMGTTAPGEVGTRVQARIGGSFLNVADGVLREMQYDIFSSGPIAISGGNFAVDTAGMSIMGGRLDYRGYGFGLSLGSGTTNVADGVIPGDANFDNIVDQADYTIWADNYNSAGPNRIGTGDFNGDNDVDQADYTLWADNYLASGDPFASAFNQSPGLANITIAGGVAKLTIPVLIPLRQVLDEGDVESDDIFVDLIFLGSIVATAPVPAAAQAIPEPSTLVLSLIAGAGMCLVGFHRKLRRRRA